MANPKTSVSFDEIIQADRQRRKNEELANEIFGRNRKTREDGRKSASRTPSLASRAGISKRSSSTASMGPQKSSPFNPPSRPSSAVAQSARTSRIATAIDSQQAHIVPSQPRATGPGLSIKGKAGPYVVEASNFAPGTTAEDIESALRSETVDDNGVNGLTSCRIVAIHPTVTAEMIFSEMQIAEKIISIYHNQKADGRILRLHLKGSGPGFGLPSRSRRNEPVHSSDTAPADASKEQFNADDAPGTEDVEMSAEALAPYDSEREAANRDRRDRESRRAEPDVQDGRYGFSEKTDSHQPPPGGSRDDRKGGRRDEERRDRDRDRDRERRYDDGRYDRRDDRGSYRRDDRPENYNARPSHYGNGVGGLRGGFGSARGGRMYSDDIVPGGRGGGGGGGRGSYRGYR